MPVERVYGQLVTVRDGDLPYLAARAAADLPHPTAPDGDRACPDRACPDRDALAVLLDDLRDLLDDGDYVPGTRLAHVRARVASALAALRAAEAGDPSTARPVRLRASVGWTRDGGLVTVGLGGYRETDRRGDDEPPEVDLGGYALELDWSGCNRLIAAVRTARVGAWGVPE